MKTNIILQGDCLAILKNIPDNFINNAIIDPPYEIESDFNLTTNDKYEYTTYNGEWDEMINFAPDIYRVLKNNSVALIFASQHNLFYNGYHLLEIGFEILNIIKWIKPDSTPNMTRKYLKHDTEFIIVARKGDKNYFNYGYSLECEDLYSKRGRQLSETWITGKTFGGKRKLHPTQKPNWLIERLINLYTKEDDVVLDCFAGSGTTGECCVRLKRKYILIEREKKYVDITTRRVSEIEERYKTNLKEFF